MEIEKIAKGWKFQLGDMMAPAIASNAEFRHFIQEGHWLLEDEDPSLKPPRWCPKCEAVVDWYLREISPEFKHLKCVQCGYPKTVRRR